MEIKNRSATHEYAIEERFDAGMVLTGTEVKAIREGKANFNDCFCFLDSGEVWIKNLHIPHYSMGNYMNHPPIRDRKLLLTKKEIRKITSRLKEQGYTLIPLRIFFNERGFAKIQIGLGRGKKMHDKRAAIKEREAKRELSRFTKR